MPTWLGVVEIAVAVVLLIGIAIVLLAVRRRWLAREGGTFECSARLHAGNASGGWALGVARYNGEMLEWFRFFSYAFRPRISLRRTEIRVVGSRDPDPVEALALYEGQRVVGLASKDSAPSQPRADDDAAWELAMDPQSLTGLLSWLEAAPPGPASPY
ncbi:MAG TPA: DUF2550 domain-containing protein [Microlunatus sp.]|nr:DUF2550 domain-containing protein [Microlunatus sp.]